MKSICTALLLLTFFCAPVYGQDAAAKMETAGKLYKAGMYLEAVELIRKLDEAADGDDEFRKDVRWAFVSNLAALSKQAFAREDWPTAGKFTEEELELLDKSDGEFTGDFLKQLDVRRCFAFKNMIVASVGKDDLETANIYREKLYERYRNKTLPDGIDRSFNFEFFRYEGRNIWGYEFYPQLSDPEAARSFTKIVYYIYSTNEDGSDKEQLYRLHVLKFHKINQESEIDYVLTVRSKFKHPGGSRTLYDYTYSDPVDLKKLRNDIRECLKVIPDPDTSVTAEDEAENDKR